jgi:hypothetical protein
VEKIISPDGTSIAYCRTGGGPPLVLVHGTTASHTRWASILPALEAQFNVYAVDRRGRGESGDGDSYALEREFEDIATFFREVVQMPPHEFEPYRALPAWQARLASAHTLPRELRAEEQYRFQAARFQDMAVPTPCSCWAAKVRRL